MSNNLQILPASSPTSFLLASLDYLKTVVFLSLKKINTMQLNFSGLRALVTGAGKGKCMQEAWVPEAGREQGGFD